MSESTEKASSLILDTSVIIDAFRGNDLIRQQLESAGVLYLPSIVVGELHRGLYKSQKADERLLDYSLFPLGWTSMRIPENILRWLTRH